MARKVGMLFPGQGSQFAGMGKELYDAYPEARRLYKDANERLGFDIAELSFNGDLETLTLTKNAQPAILLHSVAVLELLSARGVEPTIVAGHSLGEFTALVAAGFLRPLDAVQIVRRRGELMFEAGVERPGSMASIIGGDESAIDQAVEQTREAVGTVVVANYNSPAQHVISGEVAAVAAAGDACRGAGAKRVIPLNVSGAFHSPLMEPAVDEFRRYLESFDHFGLEIPWVANVTGEMVTDPDAVVDLLARQLSSPVQWIRSMETFAGAVDGPIYEVGPGNVLTGLMKRILSDVGVTPVSSPEGLESL